MKWDKTKFVSELRKKASREVAKIGESLCDFAEKDADEVSWGRGDEYGTMTYKCKSEDYGLVPLFHLTTNGQIKFPLNFLRTKIIKKEIINDFQLKLESNFMMYFDEDICPSDVYFNVDDLFLMKSEVDKFIFTIQGITARLHQ